VLLQSSRLRFLLADDPGAGKTIMEYTKIVRFIAKDWLNVT